jgi:hypothetical protein
MRVLLGKQAGGIWTTSTTLLPFGGHLTLIDQSPEKFKFQRRVGGAPHTCTLLMADSNYYQAFIKYIECPSALHVYR